MVIDWTGIKYPLVQESIEQFWIGQASFSFKGESWAPQETFEK